MSLPMMNGATACNNGIEKSNGHKRVKISPIDELEQFDEVFPTILQDCLNEGDVKNDPDIGDAIKHFLEVSKYNVPDGKKNRGISVVTSLRCLIPQPTEKELFNARVVGWCIEWLQAHFLVADDIMDHSLTRRGKPCWYKVDKIDLMAVNDSFYLGACIHKILKKYIRSEPYYVDMLELFHETTLQTIIGQGLDLLSAEDEKVDFSKFSMSRYDAIVTWKTAYYSFYLPVAAAMLIAGVADDKAYKAAKDILLAMGHFFQVQDDYLDCYGDPAVTGKVGTDIEDNKCGWLINQALILGSEEQKAELESCYARKDPECVDKVKQIFNDLSLKQVYSDYEEKTYQEIMLKIDALQVDLPKEMFIAFAKKIFKRNK